jgi:hypothetical protein
MFETTLFGALRPERADISRVPGQAQQDSDDGPWSATRHDPMHPLWGAIGPDPRNFGTAEGSVLLSACVNWIVDEVDDAFPRWRADSQSVNSTTIESSLRARAQSDGLSLCCAGAQGAQAGTRLACAFATGFDEVRWIS